MNWRERWFSERGLPYEPPIIGDLPPFRCIGRIATKPTRERQPGEDEAWDELATQP